jgi:hypothetical protein
MNLKRVFGLISIALGLAVAVLCLHQGLSMSLVFAAGLGLAGAIVATPVENTNAYKSWDITALDADLTATFAHGFGANPPDFYIITPALSFGTSATSTWGMTAAGTQFTLTKQNAAGSGGTTAGTSVVAKVWGWLPHTAAR